MAQVSLKAELQQNPRLIPQMIHSMELLQLNTQDLLGYIDRILEENPVLEQEYPTALRNTYEELRHRVNWLDGEASSDISCVIERGSLDPGFESLSSFLCDQLERKKLSPSLLALSCYLAELLDEDGYLAQEDLDTLFSSSLPVPLIDGALDCLQSLDPPGIGARNLSECLHLQLERLPNASALALTLADNFLPELGKKRYTAIAQALNVSPAEVRSAEEEISALDPHPGRAFQPAEQPSYVRPDLFILQDEQEWKVILNEYYLPKLSLSRFYCELLEKTQEKETQLYLRQKIQQANWLLSSLEQRRETLLRCSKAILDAQRPFFTGESKILSPMTLSSLAQQLELHPSTVSRAIRGKYLQCQQGTFPLRQFFSQAADPAGHSRQAVHQMLLHMIGAEDPQHPLSDQQLCQRLQEQGITLARRTVAKYRIELGIPSSSARKHS